MSLDRDIVRDTDNAAKKGAVTVTTPADLPLDWTKLSEGAPVSKDIRYPSDVCDYTHLKDSNEETYLEIIGTAGQKITNMGKDFYRTCNPNTTHVVLRSHLISKMEGIKDFRNLETLELYDNQISYLEELGSDEDGEDETENAGASLKTLDMSYNVIREMEPVKFCSNLVELFLANNKIKTLAGLKHLSNVRRIDLGANRIRKMDESELSGLVNLEELWLGKNKIEKIEGLSNLKKLRRLDVQSNRLTCVENLTSQIDTLEELYLAHNGIDDEGAMDPTGIALDFTQLTTLDLSKNRLTSCRPFAHLKTLNDLWVSSNNISSFDELEPLSSLGTRDGACLTEIYMEHNPIYNDFEYRKKLKEMIPSLVQIDANVIGATGYGSVIAQTSSPEAVVEQMRQLQEEALMKAREQQNLQKRGTTH
eukprot:CAMPEP_0194086696 /NCGR_PEP_ID=MMETSP0149-20130528/22094_1 /TAXON_ID=122233 /ORGANISM="Chaetoceros debilis, Strain MM31A-1" /LENGTH=420 /DNA_ID=CAMNT_0038769837 /DNA_START=80 /DNA_END=1342 /DNA_ORIENTATION=-